MTVKELSKKLEEGFAEIGVPFFHFRVELQEPPAAVFFEAGETYLFANDTIAETALRFLVIYLTRDDADEAKELIKAMLLRMGYTFSYKVLYDEGKDVIKHCFDCETVI